MKSKPPTAKPLDVSPLEGKVAAPLYVQLSERLAQAISAGSLAPGQQIPPEAELMATFGVSRVTVRQAIQLLARNHQVESRRGKGTFVSRPSFHQDLSNLQGFQEALRQQGVEPQTELLEFSASLGRVDASVPAGMKLPVRLRRRYSIDGEAFAVVEAYLPAEVAQLGEQRAAHLAVYEILQQFLGIRIGRADVAIQCTKASAKVATDLGLPPRSYVLVMNRTSYTTSGLPCEHMRISIVPDRYTFRMTASGPMQLASGIQPVATGVP